MMCKGKLSKKDCTKKGKIDDSKHTCAKCGVRRSMTKLNVVTAPNGSVRYICVRCLP